MTTAMLLSGGVDSSVALARLVAAGESVRAYYLKIWLEEELAFLGECPWEEDLSHARAVCERLGVELEVVPLQREYRERIISYALAELAADRTPSPDVFCNRDIKLGAFVERSGIEGPIATGHYARVVHGPSGAELHRAVDRIKDQTYFLAQIQTAQLERLVCPIGELEKSQVRATAAELGLATAERPDSQGLCFLGKISFRDFVKAHLGTRPGPIKNRANGALLGEHEGTFLYTQGQRKKLGLSGGPWYVVAKQGETLWVEHRDRLEPPRRFRTEPPHWLAPAPGDGELELKIRHGPSDWKGEIYHLENGGLEVEIDRPDAGLAPGQLAVFYRGSRCLGSAVLNDVAQASSQGAEQDGGRLRP